MGGHGPPERCRRSATVGRANGGGQPFATDLRAAAPVARVVAHAVEARRAPVRRYRRGIDPVAADQHHAPRPVRARAQGREGVVQDDGRLGELLRLDRPLEKPHVLGVVGAGEAVDTEFGERAVERLPGRLGRRRTLPPPQHPAPAPRCVTGEPGEIRHPLVDAHGLVGDRRAVHRGDQRPVRGHQG